MSLTHQFGAQDRLISRRTWPRDNSLEVVSLMLKRRRPDVSTHESILPYEVPINLHVYVEFRGEQGTRAELET